MRSYCLILISKSQPSFAKHSLTRRELEQHSFCFITRNLKSHNKEGRIKDFSSAKRHFVRTVLQKKRKVQPSFYSKLSLFASDKTLLSWLSSHYWFLSRWRALGCWWCSSPKHQTEKVVWWVLPALTSKMTSQMTTLFVFQVKFCGCFCLLSALLCVVVTVTTTVVHMNR